MASQPTLDELVVLKAELKRSRKIDLMHKLHGVSAGNKCGDCENFFRTNWDQANQHFKCKLFGVTHGEGTDWRKSYLSCGKFRRKSVPT